MSEEGGVVSEEGACFSEEGACFSEEGACFSEEGACFSEQGACSSEEGACFSEADASSSEEGASSSEEGASSSEEGACFSEEGACFSEEGACFSEEGACFSEEGACFSDERPPASDAAACFSDERPPASDAAACFSDERPPASDAAACFSDERPPASDAAAAASLAAPVASMPATEVKVAGHQVAMRGALPLLPAVLLMVTGCIHEPAVGLATGADGPAPVVETLAEAQLTVFTDDAPPMPQAARVEAPVIKPDPVRFRIGAGYGALARVDLAQCRERGLPSGYLRVRATFTHVGYVARAAVASVTLPPPAALDCIADQLRQTGVPSFDGDDARLTKTYFVEATAAAP